MGAARSGMPMLSKLARSVGVTDSPASAARNHSRIDHSKIRSSRSRAATGGRLGMRLRTLMAIRVSRYRSEEHTSELQSLMRISYAVFCLKKKKLIDDEHTTPYL